MDNSFTYMICSDDRTNAILPAAGNGILYEVMFGGLSEQYDDYMCEVVSISVTAGIPLQTTYYMFCAENLSESGYFCRSILTSKECILGIFC